MCYYIKKIYIYHFYTYKIFSSVENEIIFPTSRKFYVSSSIINPSILSSLMSNSFASIKICMKCHKPKYFCTISHIIKYYENQNFCWYHSHDICFVNVFDKFTPVILLKTPRCKSSVLFGTRTLLVISLRVLQLPTHRTKLTPNG